ncbi:MAG: hypothetical protein H5T50_10090 [Nitrososphaeria archaeon]|nr:hypothetical protein [Nitrososphaeria archaeon]
MFVKGKKFKVDEIFAMSMHMTREEKIKLVLLLIAIAAYFAGFQPLGDKIGGDAVI